jgi:hypothetical protein
MPSTSKKQHNFMAAVANNPSFAKKVGVPQSVGKDFTTADKGRKFSKGGDTMASKMNPGMMAMMAKKKSMKMADGGMPMVMKDGKKVPAFAADGKGAMKKGGMAMGKVKTAAPSRDGIAEKGKTKGTMIAMKAGGMKKMKYGGKAC